MKQKKNRSNKHTKKLLMLLILAGFSAMNINGSGEGKPAGHIPRPQKWGGSGWDFPDEPENPKEEQAPQKRNDVIKVLLEPDPYAQTASKEKKATTQASTPSKQQTSTNFLAKAKEKWATFTGRAASDVSPRLSTRAIPAKTKAAATTEQKKGVGKTKVSSPGPLTKMRNYIQNITTPTIDKIIDNTKNQLQIAFTKLNNQLKSSNSKLKDPFTPAIRQELDGQVEALREVVNFLKEHVKSNAQNGLDILGRFYELD